MRSIGVRELRQQASRYLRDVQRGETIEVTDRGRPIARLVPAAPSSDLQALESTGRLTPARGDVLDVGAPLEPEPGVKLPTHALARLRSDER